jgi:predicted nicotinamide N-methyase
MIIDNFQGTYERPSTTETLRTNKKKHDESLWDYVKHFYNARNAILNIQDIEIINVFHNGVTNIKTIEEIVMKKPKIVANLLVVVDVCFEASEARARLLDTHNKGPSNNKQQEDQEVNAANHENRKQPPTN